MKPGATISPLASITRAAEPVRLPMAVIRPPLIPMSPLKAGIREPSTIVPFFISSSYSGMNDPPYLVASGRRDPIASASMVDAPNRAAREPPLRVRCALDLRHRLWPVPHVSQSKSALTINSDRLSIGRRHCPVSGIISRRIPHYVLRGIAVDQRTQIKRMLQAAHLVLNGEEHFAAVGIDDVLEAILMLVALLNDQSFFRQAAMRPGEIVDVDLEMML